MTSVSTIMLRTVWIVASLFLAYPMVAHGWQKLRPHFAGQHADSISSSEEIKTVSSEAEGINPSDNPATMTQRRDFLNGMKSTGYLWELIGVLELLGAALLLIRPLNFFGSVLLWPITLNVFLFHVILEPAETGELLFTAGMMVVNTALLFRHWSKWRHLLFIKPSIQ